MVRSLSKKLFFNPKNQTLFLCLAFVSALSVYVIFVFGDDYSRLMKFMRITFSEALKSDSRISYNVSIELYVTIYEPLAGYGNCMLTRESVCSCRIWNRLFSLEVTPSEKASLGLHRILLGMTFMSLKA